MLTCTYKILILEASTSKVRLGKTPHIWSSIPVTSQREIMIKFIQIYDVFTVELTRVSCLFSDVQHMDLRIRPWSSQIINKVIRVPQHLEIHYRTPLEQQPPKKNDVANRVPPTSSGCIPHQPPLPTPQRPFQKPKVEVLTIYQAYKGISPQTMAWNMVLTYLHLRILKFPLIHPENTIWWTNITVENRGKSITVLWWTPHSHSTVW